MAHIMMNEAAIKVRSRELEIPFANLVCACVLEDALARIAESTDSDRLWLGNPTELGLERYKRKKTNRLEYYYSKQEEAYDVEALLEQYFREEQGTGIQWNWNLEREQEKISVRMRAKLGTMEVPVTLIFHETDTEHLTPLEWEFRLCMQNNERVNCKLYPWEYIVAKDFAEIIEKLELIHDMSSFWELHGIIHRESLNARIVQEQLVRLCEEHHVIPEKKRMTILMGYRDYSYMKKRWARYLKAEKMTSPTWDEVMSDIETFFEPIWRMLLDDTIFIADWMPELQRFLD